MKTDWQEQTGTSVAMCLGAIHRNIVQLRGRHAISISNSIVRTAYECHFLRAFLRRLLDDESIKENAHRVQEWDGRPQGSRPYYTPMPLLLVYRRDGSGADVGGDPCGRPSS